MPLTHVIRVRFSYPLQRKRGNAVKLHFLFFFIDLKVRFFIYSQPDSFFPLLPGQIYEQVEIQLAERKVGTIIGYIKRPGSTERIESSEWLLTSFTHKHFPGKT